jgi:iron complex transport system substrate-binding protein
LNTDETDKTDGMNGIAVFIRFIRFIRVAMVCCITSSAAASITVTDDLGRKVELAQPAQRIVTLAPFLTELAFSAGAGKQVVGVSAYSDYPPEARALPEVASATGIALESLAALRPDVVLAWADTLRNDDIARLGQLGMRVFVTRTRTLDDPARVLETIARLAGTDASRAAASYRERIAALRRAHANAKPVAALVEIWSQPLTTIGAGHWIDEALEACGARNAFADVPGVAPQLDWELVYRRDPQAIVGMGAPDRRGDFESRWSLRPALSAVRGKRYVYVDADLLQRPTLRLADGVVRICAGLDAMRG